MVVPFSRYPAILSFRKSLSLHGSSNGKFYTQTHSRQEPHEEILETDVPVDSTEKTAINQIGHFCVVKFGVIFFLFSYSVFSNISTMHMECLYKLF